MWPEIQDTKMKDGHIIEAANLNLSTSIPVESKDGTMVNEGASPLHFIAFR